jgi:G3E family GTPase
MLAAFGVESSGTATATGPVSELSPAIRSLPDVSVHRHGKRHDAVHEWAHRFVAVQLEVPRCLPRPRLLRWLEELPAAVIRAKGIVEFEDQPGRFHLFQRVEDTTGFTEIFVLPPGGVTLALLVGLGLDPEALRGQAERQFTSNPANATQPPAHNP